MTDSLQKIIEDTLYELRLAPRHQIVEAAKLVASRLETLQGNQSANGLDTKHWREWLGNKPMIYLSTFAGETPQRNDTNLIGLAHDALDEVDRLRLMIAVPPQADGVKP